MAKKSSGRGQRELRVKVKTARGRKLSSTRWLERQLNDPYVQRARREGYRGRAAFKILELDDKYRFLVPGARVVDLGCAPGGWCQVAVTRVNALGEKPGQGGWHGSGHRPAGGGADRRGRDLPARFHGGRRRRHGQGLAWRQGRRGDERHGRLASGHKQTDHLRIIALCEAAATFAFDVLDEGGTFAAKVLAGGAEATLQHTLKQRFAKVANVKPQASRADSSEKFVVATGFRG